MDAKLLPNNYAWLTSKLKNHLCIMAFGFVFIVHMLAADDVRNAVDEVDVCLV